MDRSKYMKGYRAQYRQHTHDVRVTLTADLYASLRAAAKSNGTTPTSLARDFIACGLTAEARIPASFAEDLRRHEMLVRNIANNINQLAHHANTVRKVIDVQSVFADLRRLEDAVRSYTTNRLT